MAKGHLSQRPPRLPSVLSASFRLIVLLLLLVACASELDIGQPVEVIIVPTQSATVTAESIETGVVASGTILESLTENTDFALFLAGWNRIGHGQIFQDDGPFTVFAPTNVAFSRLGTTSTQLDAAALESLLRHHIVARSLPPDQLAALGATPTSAGATVRLGQGDAGLKVDYATVVGEPIITGNGIIYPIDAVLIPPEPGPEKSIWGLILDDERLTSLVEVMGGTDAMYMLRFSEEPDAFLAPTNEAIAVMTLPAHLLESEDDARALYNFVFGYHLITANGWPIDENLPAAEMAERGQVETLLRDSDQFGVLLTLDVTQSGEDVMVNGARLIQTDIPAANGMLHIIDTVLIAPSLSGEE